jgi:hypothetical protein
MTRRPADVPEKVRKAIIEYCRRPEADRVDHPSCKRRRERYAKARALRALRYPSQP